MGDQKDDLAEFKPFPHFATDALHVGQDPDQWRSRAVVPPISAVGNKLNSMLLCGTVCGASQMVQEKARAETDTVVDTIIEELMKRKERQKAHARWQQLSSKMLRVNILQVPDILNAQHALHVHEEDSHDIEGFEYTRSGNPTRSALEKCLASLENAKYAMCYASGLSATFNLVHLLTSEDHIVSVDDVYGGTNRYFNRVLSHFGVQTTFVDATVPGNVVKALRPNTRMVWLETPTNPTLKLCDIAEISAQVHAVDDTIHVVVDNTFVTPYFQRPLDLGADIVMHSISKYLNGHTDVLMGCVCVNNETLYEKLSFLQNSLGAVPSPFDCYLVNRGIKTLHVRMQEHMKNGLAVAKFLEGHPNVVDVIHPFLPSHPQYELARRQMRGYSGMVSFHVRGGMNEARRFLQGLKIFCLAESLGGYESLAEHPALMTHASVPAAHRAEIGITDSLIRLSIGIEDAEDLIQDLKSSLDNCIST